MKIYEDVGAKDVHYDKIGESFAAFKDLNPNPREAHKKWTMNTVGMSSIAWAIIDAIILHSCLLAVYKSKNNQKYKVEWLQKMWDAFDGE
ncbi:MAG TPA: hypothetical protein VK145_02445 [Candidatus Nanoarchaeia archaeon]|nr:hypothetical protein [Candidatus Nanoarchaeia archaeon]